MSLDITLRICFTGFEGCLFQKLFKGHIFSLLGHLVGGKIFEEFAREKNLKKKEQCGFVGDVFIFEVKMFLTHGVEHDNSYRVIIGQFIVNETNF